MSQFVDDLVTSIGVNEPINLVVHDIGGIFGLSWLVKHPEKVRRVVVINSLLVRVSVALLGQTLAHATRWRTQYACLDMAGLSFFVVVGIPQFECRQSATEL